MITRTTVTRTVRHPDGRVEVRARAELQNKNKKNQKKKPRLAQFVVWVLLLVFVSSSLSHVDGDAVMSRGEALPVF